MSTVGNGKVILKMYKNFHSILQIIPSRLSAGMKSTELQISKTIFLRKNNKVDLHPTQFSDSRETKLTLARKQMKILYQFLIAHFLGCMATMCFTLS